MEKKKDKLYFVERILSHTIHRGKRYFLIKWIGYAESQNSWEPEENINPDLVIYYDTNFAEENDASLANTFKPATKKRKVYVGDKRKKKRPGKGKTAEVKQESVEDAEDPAENRQDLVDQYPQDLADQYPQDLADQYPQDLADQYPQDLADQYPQDLADQYPQDLADQIPDEDYDDPVSKYKEDAVEDFIEQSSNYESSESDYFYNDVKPSTSRDYQEACLSHAPTEKAPEQVNNSNFQPPSTSQSKLRVIAVEGYSNKLFKDGKLHMLVRFDDHHEPRFVPHDKFRFEYPQELIDFYESQTRWADRGIFKP